jgi:hypothetical protein
MFQHAILLFQWGRSGLHAALLAPDANPHHVAGDIFIGNLGRVREWFVAIGA